MKKKLLMIPVLLVAILLLTACGLAKKPVSVETFTKIAEGKDMIVVDVIDQFEESPQVKKANVAIVENQWQLEHYILSSKDETTSMFNKNKQAFELEKDGKSKETKVEYGSYTKYVLETDTKYKVLIKVDNMFIYGNVPIEYKEYAVELIKELGY